MRDDVYYTEWTNPENGWRYRMHIYPADTDVTSNNFIAFNSNCIASVEQEAGFEALAIGRPDAQLLKVKFVFATDDAVPDLLKDYLSHPVTTLASGGSDYYKFMRDVARNSKATNSVVLYSDRGQSPEGGGAITGCDVGSGGSGYTNGTYGTTGGHGTGAQCTIVVSTGIGQVWVYELTQGGAGYRDGTFGVTTGSGTGATFTVTQSGGVVQTAVVSNRGTGYQVGDVLHIDDGDGDAHVVVNNVSQFNGEIMECEVSDGGSGYQLWDVLTVNGGIGTIVVNAVDIPDISYVVEFAGCQKRFPTHKVVQRRETYTSDYQEMEIEFVDLAKMILENSTLKGLNAGTYEGYSAQSVSNWGRLALGWGGQVGTNRKLSRYYNMLVGNTSLDWTIQLPYQISEYGRSAYVWSLYEVYQAFESIMQLVGKGVCTGLSDVNLIYHDHETEGVGLVSQAVHLTTPTPITSGMSFLDLYVVGYISNDANNVVDKAVGGLFSETKGAWSEYGNLWNLFEWLFSNFGVRLRWYYSAVSAPNYAPVLNIKAEPIFVSSGETVDTGEHLATEYAEIEIGANSIRSSEAHAKNLDYSEKNTKEWKYEQAGSDAETNAEYQLPLSNVPTLSTTPHQSTILKVKSDEYYLQRLSTASNNSELRPVPSGEYVRVNENSIWNLGESVFKYVQSDESHPTVRAQNSTIGYLLSKGTVEVFGKHEQAEVELTLNYAGKYGAENLGRLYTIDTRLPARYDYIGTDAIYTGAKIDHLAGTVDAKFFILDIANL